MQLMRMSFIELQLAAVVGAALCGCNKTTTAVTAAKTLPVTGKITLDGKPLAGADVVFTIPDPLTTFFDTTKDDGAYQLQAIEGRNESLKGRAKVTVSRMVLPNGSPWLKDQPPALVGAIEQLPPKYSMLNSTELAADLVPEGGTFDFDLKSK